MEKTQNPVKVLYANKSVHGMDNSIVVLGGEYDSNPNTKLDWFQVFELNLGNQWNPEIHSEEEVAAKLFQILNMDSNPLGTPEKQEMIKSLGLSHTSMSIGDMVEFPNGKKLVCVSEGWEEMRGNLFLTEAEAFTN